jgi:hypothetical protein
MVFANEFERLKQRMEESRDKKDDPAKEMGGDSDTDDEQLFNSSIKQLWQQAVDVHQRNTEAADLKPVTKSIEELALKEATESTLLVDSEVTMEEEQPVEIGQEQDLTGSSHFDGSIEELTEEKQLNNSMLEELNFSEVGATTEDTLAHEPFIEERNSTLLDLTESTTIGSVKEFALDFSNILPDEEPAEGLSGQEMVESLAQISLEQLYREINELMDSLYSYYQMQLQELFGVQVPQMDMINNQATKVSDQLNIIANVATGNGKVSEEAVQAVNELLPILWKSFKEDSYRIPEAWYGTHLGYLCRYIKSGAFNQKFDPIDLPTAATMLHMTEKELIEIYPRLGGVKLSTGYIFSRQKVEEFKGEVGDTFSPVTVEMMQTYYRSTKECLTKLMRIHHVLNDSYDEIRYTRDLLLSGIDFSTNRIKHPVKTLIEQRLAAIYQKYQGIHELNFEQIEVGQNEFAGYTAPNIFVVLEQFGSNTLTGNTLAGMLEEMIKYIDDERTKMNDLTAALTKNLGQLNIEIEMLKIKQAL